MNNLPQPSTPNNGNHPGQIPWPGPGPNHPRMTSPGYISPHAPYGYSPLSNQSPRSVGGQVPPRMASPQSQYGGFLQSQRGGFLPGIASPPFQHSGYTHNYCVRCVPGGPLCPCYARANAKLLTRETATQVDMSDITGSRYTKEEYFQDGTDASKVLSVSECNIIALTLTTKS